MNKLNIVSGFVTSIQDIGFLQKSVEEALAKVVSVAANLNTFIDACAIATGFDLGIVGNQIRVYNNNSFNIGYAIDNQSRPIKYIPDPNCSSAPFSMMHFSSHVLS